MLNRHNLNIAKLASKEESRFTLSAIRVTPAETVVTDGHVLVRVSNPTMPVEQFPALPGATITDDFKPFNLPAAAALQLAKSFKKRCTIPVLGCAAVDTAGEVPSVVTTDLDNVTRCKSMEGSFPDFERVIPKDDAMTFEISVNPFLLKALLEQFCSFVDDAGRTAVRLQFQDAGSAISIDAKGGDEQTMRALLMPMRNGDDSAATVVFNARKDSAAILRSFASGAYTFEGGSMDLTETAAAVLGRARKALKIEPPAEVPAELDLDSESHAWGSELVSA